MSSVKISNSVIFAIQVTLEDADDNEHDKYGKSIFFPQLLKFTSFFLILESNHPLNNDRKYHPPSQNEEDK